MGRSRTTLFRRTPAALTYDIGLRQSAGRLGEVARLTRVDLNDRQLAIDERHDQRHFESVGRFGHDEGRLQLEHARH
jgi:hypothetical protein